MTMILAECAQYPADFPQLLCGDLNAKMNNPVVVVVAAISKAGWSDPYVALHGPADPGFTVHNIDAAAKITAGRKTGKNEPPPYLADSRQPTADSLAGVHWRRNPQ